jgi:hypothetical protein
MLTLMEPRHGSSKVMLSPHGNRQVSSCGFVGSVCVSHLSSLALRLMACHLAGAGKTVLWYVTWNLLVAGIYVICKFDDRQ